jgi:homoserine O-acetyltransferase
MGARPTQLWRSPRPFRLESGKTLPELEVAYRTWGRLSPGRDNAVLVCHALTGSADVDLWWPGVLGPGRALDPKRDYVICSNVLGSCYGSTGPTRLDPASGAVWGERFPEITVRDMVRAQALLLDALGVRRLALVVGGSLGGMQVLEWGVTYPERVAAMIPIATAGRSSAWCLAFSEAQRAALEGAQWGGRGLAVARMIAMCTYRSPAELAARFGRTVSAAGGFAVQEYLRHQGEKLVARFDPHAYRVLLRAMDTHDVSRGRGEYETVLRRVEVPALVLSIDSDVLFFPAEQQELARLLPRAELVTLKSSHGHDGFLVDVDNVNEALAAFRRVAIPRAG